MMTPVGVVGSVGEQRSGALDDVVDVDAEVSSTTSPGALAPKRSMPITSSAYLCQPSGTPASTASTGTPAGKIVPRNSASC